MIKKIILSALLVTLMPQVSYGDGSTSVVQEATYKAKANVEMQEKKKINKSASPYDKVTIKKKKTEYTRENPKCGNCPNSKDPE